MGFDLNTEMTKERKQGQRRPPQTLDRFKSYLDQLLAKPVASTEDMAEFTEMAELGIDEWAEHLEAEDKA